MTPPLKTPEVSKRQKMRKGPRLTRDLTNLYLLMMKTLCESTLTWTTFIFSTNLPLMSCPD